MAKRNRPGKRERMLAKSRRMSTHVSMDAGADYGRSCCDLNKNDLAGLASPKWEYNGRTAGVIHRAK